MDYRKLFLSSGFIELTTTILDEPCCCGLIECNECLPPLIELELIDEDL